MCRPFLLASFLKLTRARECTTAGFLMMRPSRCRRAMLRRELAKAISLVSLGSNQILRFPHLRTEAARRFWSLRLTAIKWQITIGIWWVYYFLPLILSSSNHHETIDTSSATLHPSAILPSSPSRTEQCPSESSQMDCCFLMYCRRHGDILFYLSLQSGSLPPMVDSTTVYWQEL